MAARCATLEDSAKELAGKIAAMLPARSEISLGIQNSSSLLPGEVTRIEETLKVELQNRGLRIPTIGSASVSVKVTLSENMKGFIWTAEIPQGDTPRVAMVEVPRPAENQDASNFFTITFRADKFLDSPKRMLDAALFPGSGGRPIQLVLFPTYLSAYEIGTDVEGGGGIPSSQMVSRDPDGVIVVNGNSIEVSVTSRAESEVCTYFQNPSLSLPSSGECDPEPAKKPAVSGMPHHGDQYVETRTGCGSGTQVLVTGVGDYTQADSVQVFDKTRRGDFSPLIAEQAFQGPILGLHAATGGVATAIVHNLKTGNYEAYHLYISCVQ